MKIWKILDLTEEQVNHIDNKKNCSPSNVITVCFSCNARANFNREFWQEHYEEIMIEQIKGD